MAPNKNDNVIPMGAHNRNFTEFGEILIKPGDGILEFLGEEKDDIFKSAVKCCVPIECLQNQLIQVSDLQNTVKVYCTNRNCTAGNFMHQKCYDEWENLVLEYLKNFGKAHYWKDKAKLENLCTRKGYEMVYKSCLCRCGNGFLKNDKYWKETGISEAKSVGNQTTKRRRKGQKKAGQMLNGVVTPRQITAGENHVNGFISREKMNGFSTLENMNGFVTPEKMNGFMTLEKMNGYMTPGKMNTLMALEKINNGFLGTEKINGFVSPEKMNGYKTPKKMNGGFMSPEMPNGFMSPEIQNGFMSPEMQNGFMSPEKMVRYMSPEKMNGFVSVENRNGILTPEGFVTPEKSNAFIRSERMNGVGFMNLERMNGFTTPEKMNGFGATENRNGILSPDGLTPEKINGFMTSEKMIRVMTPEKLTDSSDDNGTDRNNNHQIVIGARGNGIIPENGIGSLVRRTSSLGLSDLSDISGSSYDGLYSTDVRSNPVDLDKLVSVPKSKKALIGKFVKAEDIDEKLVPKLESMRGNGIFNRRENYKDFGYLHKDRLNDYNIKCTDDGNNGNDETRIFVLSNFFNSKRTTICCVLCSELLHVYDRYPLINGTLFLSPKPRHDSSLEVTHDQKKKYLSAVCISCLEGRSFGRIIKCRSCRTPWDGTTLIIGTMYTYDIFAAQPCCNKRIWCHFCCTALTEIHRKIKYFGEYSRTWTCPHCGDLDFHFIKSLDACYGFERIP